MEHEAKAVSEAAKAVETQGKGGASLVRVGQTSGLHGGLDKERRCNIKERQPKAVQYQGKAAKGSEILRKGSERQ